LHALSTEVAKLKIENSNLRVQSSDQSLKIGFIEDSKVFISKDLSELQEENAKLIETISDLAESLSLEETDPASTVKEIVKALKAAELEIKNLRSEKGAVSESSSVLESRVEKLESKIEVKNSQIAALKESLQEVSNDKTRLEIELEVLKKSQTSSLRVEQTLERLEKQISTNAIPVAVPVESTEPTKSKEVVKKSKKTIKACSDTENSDAELPELKKKSKVGGEGVAKKRIGKAKAVADTADQLEINATAEETSKPVSSAVAMDDAFDEARIDMEDVANFEVEEEPVVEPEAAKKIDKVIKPKTVAKKPKRKENEAAIPLLETDVANKPVVKRRKKVEQGKEKVEEVFQS
jgi:hypothetical protein